MTCHTRPTAANLSRGKLGDSFGTLGYSMLSKLTGEHQTYSSLNLSGRESRLLIVSGKLSSLGGDTLEDIIDEGVHDGHSLLGDTGIRVDLLEYSVDVGGVRFDALLATLLSGGGLLGCLGAYGLLRWCLCHGYFWVMIRMSLTLVQDL